MSVNPFLTAPEERLSRWKVFRRSLHGLETTEQLAQVAEFWSKAPLGPRAYDPYDASCWLTPWEMIHHNQWCRSSVAIGMENTLRLSGIDSNRLCLRLITDAIYDALLVLIVDDSFVLNYDWGSVHPLPLSGHEVIREWRFVNRDYFQMNY
jgi:hypothetical protein